MKIAVFVDEQGMTAPLGQPGYVKVYTRDGGGWQTCLQIPFALSASLTLNEIRQRTLTMLADLPQCRHFVAREIHGALLAWLDGMGLTMWQGSGQPEDFLDNIASRIAAVPAPVTPLPQAFIVPGAEKGTFRVDLLAALQGGGSHTSKRLLMPFFEQRNFTSLEILCDHLPKWFSTLNPRELSWTITPAEKGLLTVNVRLVP
ncbi:Fe-only nitrogenase accessory AnfO family protein [Phytobacter sp. V91]|uniref:Fe-only nitrogenase accessory AnfO family protein n=1 Tax=Phytobacter sp. V91 TaxID=3369425 RepID=UPI003F62DA4F